MTITCIAILFLTVFFSIHITAQPTLTVSPFNRTTLLAKINETPLNFFEKRDIIRAATAILSSIFVNLNLATNIHKASPISQLDQLAAFPPSPNHLFHEALRHVFQSLNDFHTVYKLPPPASSITAHLLFTIRIFYTDPPNRRYVVSKIFEPDRFAANPNFKVGVEVITYDRLPIDEAVIKLGINTYAANFQAALLRGEELLTVRSILIDPIPDQDYVLIGFRTANGILDQILVPWIYLQARGPASQNLLTRHVLPWAHHGPGQKPRYNVPTAPSPSMPTFDFGSIRVPATDRIPIPVASDFQSLFSAEVIITKFGSIGRLTLPSFASSVNLPLVTELSRILNLMPPNGLIIDIRANRGGQPPYAKALVELFSDIPIPPMPISIRTTELQERLLNLTLGNPSGYEDRFFSMFQAAVRSGLRAGEEYTGPVGDLFSDGLISRSPRLNRAYFGPVITLIDGITYSAGDIFAALQVDQGHSLLVGVSENTGAGGATIKKYRDFVRLYPHIFDPLPQGVDFTTALARFHRSGELSGAIVEAFGVKPDIRYYLTYEDVINNDCALFEYLAEILVLRKTELRTKSFSTHKSN